MRTFSLAGILILLAAAVATYGRYGSYDPCQWMETDMVKSSGLPHLVVRARIKAHFLVDGVTNPDLGQCLMGWWKSRADGLPGGS